MPTKMSQIAREEAASTDYTKDYVLAIKPDAASPTGFREVMRKLAAPFKLTVCDLGLYVAAPDLEDLTLAVIMIPKAMTLPKDLDGSKFSLVTGPSTNVVLTLKKNATTIGTLTIEQGANPVFTPLVSAAQAFAVGDKLTITHNYTAETGFRGLSMSLHFTL